MKKMLLTAVPAIVALGVASAGAVEIQCPSVSRVNQGGDLGEWDLISDGAHIGSLDRLVSVTLIRSDKTKLRCHYTPDTFSPPVKSEDLERLLSGSIVTSANFEVRESDSSISDCLSDNPADCNITVE